MAWFITPREIAGPDGAGIGKFRLTAKSDEDGGGPWGLCDHEHATAKEALECSDAQARAATY